MKMPVESGQKSLSQVKIWHLSILSDKIPHLSVTTTIRTELKQAVAITSMLFSIPYIV